MHTPVFLSQAIEALQVRPGGKYIDATAGEGGHLREIIARGAKVLALDWNQDQIEQLKKEFAPDQVSLVCTNFAEIATVAKKQGFYPVEGIIFDLGLSMREIAQSKSGFSYRSPSEPLDMRLNQETVETAATIVDSYSVDELYEIFARYSEELNSLGIAESIVRSRRIKKILTVGDLLSAINRAIGEKNPEKNQIYSRIFQALRIIVNQEMQNLEQGLVGSLEILKTGGRLVIITFHSIEDRLVKLFARKNRLALELVEIKNKQKFERSAKLRVLVKT